MTRKLFGLVEDGLREVLVIFFPFYIVRTPRAKTWHLQHSIRFRVIVICLFVAVRLL